MFWSLKPWWDSIQLIYKLQLFLRNLRKNLQVQEDGFLQFLQTRNPFLQHCFKSHVFVCHELTAIAGWILNPLKKQKLLHVWKIHRNLNWTFLQLIDYSQPLTISFLSWRLMDCTCKEKIVFHTLPDIIFSCPLEFTTLDFWWQVSCNICLETISESSIQHKGQMVYISYR